mgnify:CR=1 FL=1
MFANSRRLARISTALMLLVLMSALSAVAVQAAEEQHTSKNISLAKDLQASAAQLLDKKVLLLYVSAPSCSYCERLEQQILDPLLVSGHYTDKLLLRKINWESDIEVINFAGVGQLPVDLLLDYEIIATPTLLLLDKNGRQLAQPIVGYNGSDYYWHYLDLAIDESIAILAGAD